MQNVIVALVSRQDQLSNQAMRWSHRLFTNRRYSIVHKSSSALRLPTVTACINLDLTGNLDLMGVNVFVSSLSGRNF